MMFRSQLSVAISLALHILAFLIFAGVRIYDNEGVKDEIAVAFVERQETERPKRSLDVRPMVSAARTPQRPLSGQRTVNPDYESTVEFYYEPSKRVFSEVKSIGKEVFQNTEMQRPDIRERGDLRVPMAVDLLNNPHLREAKTQPGTSDGRDLLTNVDLPKPELELLPTRDFLQSFLSEVRRRIESKKKYPIAAQEAKIRGYAIVRMTILKDGQLENAEISESSGYEILDRAALQSVRDAVPFPPIPKKVRLNKINTSIRLVFKL